MSFINEYRNLLNFSAAGEPDIFISCASFEERCTSALLSATEEYSPSWVILMYSREHIDKGRTKEFFESLHKAATHFSKKEPLVIDFNISLPKTALNRFRESLQKIQTIFPRIRVTLDITTFPRQILFSILREINHIVPRLTFRLLYSEPKRYSTERKGGWLTRGVKSVVPMYGYGGVQDPTLKKLLVIMTGHEGERAYITWRRHQPDKTVLIPQGEPYHEGLNNISEVENKLLFAVLGDVCRYNKSIPARAVDSVYLDLERIYARYAHEYYFVIAPMGTKLQSLGVYLFAESRPDVQLTYAVPVYYNFEDYSTGIHKRWEIRDLNPYGGCGLR